jgi:hypothetical protein
MRKVLILLLALLAGPVAAQQFPITLPQDSVYGRLGIGSGPGQAIPFANLLAGLNGVAWGGAARMIPHVGQTTSPSDCYSLTDPYGNPIACSTSTTTQGLQEFLNATTSNGWPAVVYCQGTEFPSKTEPVFIEATTSVTVPVAQDWSFHSYGCNLNFSVTTVPGLIVDSLGASVFDWDGKIVYNVTAPNGNTTINPSCVVYINPQTNTADGFAGLYAGYFRIKSPVNNPQGGATSTGVVCINASAGSTIEERLDFTEVNANDNAYHGVFVFGATASTGLMQSEISINQIHGAVTDGVNVGSSSTDQANYNANIWKISNIESFGGSSRGIDSFGSGDIFDVGVINAAQGGLATGIVTESGATYNKFRFGSITGFTAAAWSDSGTCNEFSGASGVASQIVLTGGTSGCMTFQVPAAASGSITWPDGTTNFSATGGANQVVQQSSAGAPFTVGQLSCSSLSNSGSDCSAAKGQLPGTTTNDNATAGNVGEFRSVNCGSNTATVTITIASPAVISWASHPFLNSLTEIDACPVKFTTTGALPTGITAGTTYWIIPSSIVAGTSFEIATSPANALAGTAVNTTGTQSGTQTATNLTSDAVNNSANAAIGLSLTAGDWQCSGVITDNPAGTTVVSQVTTALNTSVALPAVPAGGSYFGLPVSLTGTARSIPIGSERFSLASTTTIFGIMQPTFTTSTEGLSSELLGCRRMR